MSQNLNLPAIALRQPWNKGKLIGAKPPLRSKHVWSIRTKLQLSGKTRDLALFNLALDSKLRGRDVVSIRVEDIGDDFLSEIPFSPCGILTLIPVSQDHLGGDTGN
jgi:hypothetical protein